MNLRALLVALLVSVLAACSGDTADVQPPTDQLSEAETNRAFGDLSGELLGMVFSMNSDASGAALRSLPADSADFPLFTQGEEQTLPRGRYSYDAASDVWQPSGDSDDLALTWTYDTVRASGVEATLTIDWNAGGDTVRVAGPGGATLEAPTSFNVGLVAADQTVADVDLALGYYNMDECGTADGIAEPTSLGVNGAGSLVDLENVGYSVDDGDVATQGKVTLKHEGAVTLEWDIDVVGERERSGCFTSAYTPLSGSVEVSLAADAGSFALSMDVDSIDLDAESLTLSNGTLQINGRTAVSFMGVLDDSNANGVPGENVAVSFANGQTVTLEQILQSSNVGMLLRLGNNRH